MLQYPTSNHMKEDGTYCGSPALRDRKYCYYHLTQRGRRLRRAQALRDNLPYRLEIQSLDNPYAIRAALTEIAQALASGQLESRTAGKLLYAIQQASAINRRIEQMEAAQVGKMKDEEEGVPQVHAPHLGVNLGSDASRIQEYPEFEKHFGIPPGVDLDAEADAILRQADEDRKDRKAEAMPEPPPGMRPGSPAYRVYREEAYQVMRLQLLDMRAQLRDYNQQKRDKLKKEVMSSQLAPDRRADSA